jgi:hypothetical protein
VARSPLQGPAGWATQLVWKVLDRRQPLAPITIRTGRASSQSQYRLRHPSSANVLFYGSSVPGGLGHLTVEVSRSYSETPHSEGILWTSDQPDAETSDNTRHRHRHPCLGGIRIRNPRKRAATGIGAYVLYSFITLQKAFDSKCAEDETAQTDVETPERKHAVMSSVSGSAGSNKKHRTAAWIITAH